MIEGWRSGGKTIRVLSCSGVNNCILEQALAKFWWRPFAQSVSVDKAMCSTRESTERSSQLNDHVLTPVLLEAALNDLYFLWDSIQNCFLNEKLAIRVTKMCIVLPRSWSFSWRGLLLPGFNATSLPHSAYLIKPRPWRVWFWVTNHQLSIFTTQQFYELKSTWIMFRHNTR